MLKRSHSFRYFIITAGFFVACLLIVIRLVNLQITGADHYKESFNSTYIREEKIYAKRGEIYDRNGIALVKNDYSETVRLDYASLPSSNSARNASLAGIIGVLLDHGVKIETSMPVTGTYPHVEFDAEALESGSAQRGLERFLKAMNYRNDVSCINLFEGLLEDYGLISEEGEMLYSGEVCDLIIRIRYDLEVTYFAPDNPYTLAEDVSLELITSVLEANCRGVEIYRETSRIYTYPGVASNVLGIMGKIPEAELDEYLELGYGYDATVGIFGAEEAFESILKGKDGVRVIEEDEYGNVIRSYVKEEPIPGLDVYLTIDIDLQKHAEEALERSIKELVEKALASGEENTGEKADSGALTVVDPSSGQVLALASYPSYDLTTYYEDYSKLASDETNPLFDRALLGNYQPGSTFKIATGIAALCSGTVTTETTVYDTGRYEYYPDYQPSCWYRWGHGTVDIESALGHSCNYYFFDVGRKTGITTLNHYCTQLGLGCSTGIELRESTGTLAGPENAAENGVIWVPGDTLQASIGQSANAATPLQLASYISTVINGGTRYKSTVLYKTSTYSGKDEKLNQKEVLNTLDIPDEYVEAIRVGMKNSKEWTSATKRYKFDVGSKTGTAQTTANSNNAVFVAFAPYNDPEIVVSCVIEDGYSGSNASPATFSVISHFFNLNEDGSPKS